MIWLAALLVIVGIVALAFTAFAFLATAVSGIVILLVAAGVGFAIGSAISPEGGVIGAGLAVVAAIVALFQYGSSDDPKTSTTGSSSNKISSESLPPRLQIIINRYQECGAAINQEASNQLRRALKEIQVAFNGISSESRDIARLLKAEDGPGLVACKQTREVREDGRLAVELVRTKVTNAIAAYNELLWGQLPNESRTSGSESLTHESSAEIVSTHIRNVEQSSEETDELLNQATQLVESKPNLLSRAFKAITKDDSYERTKSEVSVKLSVTSDKLKQIGDELEELVITQMECHTAVSVHKHEKPGLVDRFLGVFRKPKQARLT